MAKKIYVYSISAYELINIEVVASSEKEALEKARRGEGEYRGCGSGDVILTDEASTGIGIDCRPVENDEEAD